MDGELQHMFHEHPLILKAESRKSNDDIDHPDLEISCEGCLTPILGPFYSCVQCPYFLHKVCAELPNQLEHPIHQQHPLCLLSKAHYGNCICDLCYKTCEGFVYHCAICKFDVDTMCAATSHTIIDKCHMHPLILIQMPTSFFCHICIKKEEGVSYKCTVCPFWVHQNCIVLLPDTVKHSDHRHLLTLLPSVPLKYRKYSNRCDICYDELFPFQCRYYCEGCKFFAHINCGRSETSSSLSRDQDIPHDGQSPVLLPMKQHSIDLISWFVRNYIDGDANIDDKIDHFDHEHPLLLLTDEKTSDNKTCEACAVRISSPSYGCVKCDYFLHKCCTDLPKQISHPLHPQHRLALRSRTGFIQCKYCKQCCNSFIYKCSECENFKMDIKCGSIMEGGVVYHEAHKHPLFPRLISSITVCTACGTKPYSEYILQCNTCNFELCFECAMAPAVIKHRYGGKTEEPFRLKYSPPENHYEDEYLCEICLKVQNPKQWYYHCLCGDQFAHVHCMVWSGADSNIKYGKSHLFEEVHKQHEVTTISCKYNCYPCSKCRYPMRTGLYGGAVGFECKTCNFRCHLWCPSD